MELRFRTLRREDYSLLIEWFAKDHVATWWHEAGDLDSIEARYGPSVDARDPTEVFIVQQGPRPIGLIQRYLIDEYPDWKRSLAVAGIPAAAAGIDYLVGDESLIGQGVGAEMISRFVEDTWRRCPDVAAIAVAVQQENRRSWRALEKSGFHRTWAGALESDDPDDREPNFVYVRHRQ